MVGGGLLKGLLTENVMLEPDVVAMFFIPECGKQRQVDL